MSLIELVEQQTAEPEPAQLALVQRAGKVVTVWGSAGSGKTLLAINLAFQLAEANRSVALLDLDTKRPSIAASLGIVEPGAGITALARLARQRSTRATRNKKTWP
jgi:Mrp family chromosome partitioning ATPase